VLYTQVGYCANYPLLAGMTTAGTLPNQERRSSPKKPRLHLIASYALPVGSPAAAAILILTNNLHRREAAFTLDAKPPTLFAPPTGTLSVILMGPGDLSSDADCGKPGPQIAPTPRYR
jgi:hypothetical protein